MANRKGKEINIERKISDKTNSKERQLKRRERKRRKYRRRKTMKRVKEIREERG